MKLSQILSDAIAGKIMMDINEPVNYLHLDKFGHLAYTEQGKQRHKEIYDLTYTILGEVVGLN